MACSNIEGRAAFLELPHDCLLQILCRLSEFHVCRVARVCRLLRAIADSDEVWATRLPSDAAVASSCSSSSSLSNKDLFFRLRAGMLYKDPSQPYWRDPSTGEGCFAMSARNLMIQWADDLQIWRWEQHEDSWFSESAHLVRICWFEVCGKCSGWFLPGDYRVSFKLQLTCEFHGWAEWPVQLSLSSSNGQRAVSQQVLSSECIPCSTGSWVELHVGEFHVEDEMHLEVHFSMMEIESGELKKGIVLDGVKIQNSGTSCLQRSDRLGEV